MALLTSHSYAQGKSAKAKGKKPAAQKAGAKPEKPVPKSKELVEATAKLKADLEHEIAIREANLIKLSQELKVEARKKLYQEGLVTKQQVEEAERKIATARAELDLTKQKMIQADNTIAEAIAMERLTNLPPLRVGTYSATAAMIRYNGPSAWVLTDIAKVDSYFVSQFKHSLPVSAFGQTDVHNRLGFDHRNSVDVALHPDSAEGQALINYLRSAGIPFIAFRQAVPGSATGAHIHIGYPSHRFTR